MRAEDIPPCEGCGTYWPAEHLDGCELGRIMADFLYTEPNPEPFTSAMLTRVIDKLKARDRKDRP